MKEEKKKQQNQKNFNNYLNIAHETPEHEKKTTEGKNIYGMNYIFRSTLL